MTDMKWPPTWTEGLQTEENMKALISSFVNNDPAGGADFLATRTPAEVYDMVLLLTALAGSVVQPVAALRGETWQEFVEDMIEGTDGGPWEDDQS